MKKTLVEQINALANAASNVQVTFGIEDYDIILVDNYNFLSMDNFSDGRKVEFIKECMPTEIVGKKVKYDTYTIAKADFYAKRYNGYFLIKDDESYMGVAHNLGDGRMILIGYYLVDK